MTTNDRWAVRVGATLSIVLGLWGLAVMPFPLGFVGGSAVAVLGLAFGAIALARPAWGRWRKLAVAGIAISSLALLVAAVEVVVLALVG